MPPRFQAAKTGLTIDSNVAEGIAVKHCINIFLLITMLTALTGCQRFRQLTRRDYALMKDPFATKLAEDGRDGEEPPLPGIEPTKTGYVSVGDTAVEQGAAQADYSMVAHSEEPPATGPSLSDFMTDQNHSNPQTIHDSQSPGSKDPEADMANIAAFLENQAENSGLTQTATELHEDFAAYAAQKQKQWKQQVGEAQEQATPLIQKPIRQVSRSVQTAADEFAAATAEFDVIDSLTNNAPAPAANESATPLLRQPATAAAAAPKPGRNPFAELAAETPEQPFKAPASAQASQNPPAPLFDESPTETDPTGTSVSNPFEQMGVQNAPPAATPDKQMAPGSTLDAGFNFDSGWRPSNAVHP